MLQISFYSNHLETILHLKKHSLWSSTGTHLNCYVCLINAKLSLILFTLLGGEFLKFWCLAVKCSESQITFLMVLFKLCSSGHLLCTVVCLLSISYSHGKKVFCIKTYKLIWCLRSLSIRLTTMPEIKHNTWHVTLFHNLFSKNIAKKQGVCRFSHIASHCFHRDKKGK